MIICVGSLFVACLPVTQTNEGATTEGTETQEPTGFANIFTSYGTWIWLAILVVAFYFLLIRPQRTRSKKAQELMSSLQRGDEVVTIGGIHGRIKDIREDVIIMTIASGVDIKVNKSAVSRKASQ
ncbi:MAG: preprotein translocase subunit YajC [Actinobacteria bacterium]|nr:preprotein translocase subunit YajC [Actinomycetota bacterium]